MSRHPAWLVVILLVTGALITFLAEKLPGEGGHTPLHGFGIDIGPREILSVIIAALGSLSFGAVLGPEAPLMAIGTALGALAFRDPSKPIRQVMMIVGAMAAIGAIFGNPLVTCVLMLEFAMLAGARMATPLVLMPALAGMAASYVLQVGVEQWSGLGEAQLAVPDLAPYPEVQFADLAVSVPLAILVAVATMAARLGALRVAALAARSRLGTMVGGAVVVALAAIAVDAITGGGLELVLFSGQSAMPDYLALTSLGTALVVLAGQVRRVHRVAGQWFPRRPDLPGRGHRRDPGHQRHPARRGDVHVRTGGRRHRGRHRSLHADAIHRPAAGRDADLSGRWGDDHHGHHRHDRGPGHAPGR